MECFKFVRKIIKFALLQQPTILRNIPKSLPHCQIQQNQLRNPKPYVIRAQEKSSHLSLNKTNDDDEICLLASDQFPRGLKLINIFYWQSFPNRFARVPRKKYYFLDLKRFLNNKFCVLEGNASIYSPNIS